MRSTILVIDDEPNILTTVRRSLELEGYQVIVASGGAAGLAKLAEHDVDLVLLDVMMPGDTGLEVLPKIRGAKPEVVVVMMSGNATIETAVNATKAGAHDFIEKPLSGDKLLITVQNALENARLRGENARLRGRVQTDFAMIGRGAAMKAIFEKVAKTAPSTGRVLITGENGTGKELVARAVHEHSKRKTGPFVKLNCAAIPAELIESELFGHEKGAFTGATQQRRGKFELADGGTLFLDEIGDVSAKVQAQLLRVLQEGEIRRVGGNQPIEVDVRVITATHRDLQVEMVQGRIRSDLFYRLSVVTLEVPSLRDRGDDLLALTRHFAARHSLELGRPNPEISEAALAVIREHRWPGNVRELENAMARAVAMCRGDVILPSDLPPTVLRVPALAELRSGAAAIDSDWPTLELLEQRYIAKALDHTDQNKTAAAQLLGIDRRTLQRMGNKD